MKRAPTPLLDCSRDAIDLWCESRASKKPSSRCWCYPCKPGGSRISPSGSAPAGSGLRPAREVHRPAQHREHSFGAKSCDSAPLGSESGECRQQRRRSRSPWTRKVQVLCSNNAFAPRQAPRGLRQKSAKSCNGKTVPGFPCRSSNSSRGQETPPMLWFCFNASQVSLLQVFFRHT